MSAREPAAADQSETGQANPSKEGPAHPPAEGEDEGSSSHEGHDEHLKEDQKPLN